MTSPNRPPRRPAYRWLLGVLLLVLLPTWVGIAFQVEFGEPFIYLGYGVGFLLGAAAFFLERRRWRQ